VEVQVLVEDLEQILSVKKMLLPIQVAVVVVLEDIQTLVVQAA
jgi:hypothetical protein